MPKPFETGNAAPEYPSSPKDLYRQHFFEAFDLVTLCIKDRFNQPGFQMYRHLQDVLIKNVVGDETIREDIDCVMNLYKNDLNESVLKTQLLSLNKLLQSEYEDLNKVTIQDIIKVTIQDI